MPHPREWRFTRRDNLRAPPRIMVTVYRLSIAVYFSKKEMN